MRAFLPERDSELSIIEKGSNPYYRDISAIHSPTKAYSHIGIIDKNYFQLPETFQEPVCEVE